MLKVIAVILTGLLVLLQYRLLEKARQEQILENNVLRERNRSLTAEVLDLKTGLEAIEERARTEMGMIKQGETFYQIVNMKQQVSSPPKNN